MDARMPVTHEEGDRYPLEPPISHSDEMVDMAVLDAAAGKREGSSPSYGTILRCKI